MLFAGMGRLLFLEGVGERDFFRVGEAGSSALVLGRHDVSLSYHKTRGPHWSQDLLLPVILPFVLAHFLSLAFQPSDKFILGLNQPESVLFLHQITELDTERNTDRS